MNHIVVDGAAHTNASTNGASYEDVDAKNRVMYQDGSRYYYKVQDCTAQPGFDMPPKDRVLFQEGSRYYYKVQDCKSMQQASLERITDLQANNENLGRQISHLTKKIKTAGGDSLTLIAERERLQFLFSRNTGEIFKIHVENEERLKRIARLEAENKQLQLNMANHRDNFSEGRNDEIRTHYATEFYLSQSKIERNNAELNHLNQD